ncbi:hypothetical protein PG988_006395 [Apiospora saccharicola]
MNLDSPYHLTCIPTSPGNSSLRELRNPSLRNPPQWRGQQAERDIQNPRWGYVGTRLNYKSHHVQTDDGNRHKTLDVVLHDEQTGITVTSRMVLFDGLPVLRSSTAVQNDGKKDVLLTQISSLVIGGLTRSKEWWADFTVSYATNAWFREAQWS